MADADQGFEKMFDIWKEGQEAFFEAQKKAVSRMNEMFSASLNNPEQSSLRDWIGAFDFDMSFTDWDGLIKAWAAPWGSKSDQEKPFTPFDPENWNLQNWQQYTPEQLRLILGNIAQGPRFADMATPHRDAAEAWREVLDYQKAAAEFSTVMQAAWGRAYQTFSKQYSLDYLKVNDGNENLEAWLKIANDELLETQGSQAFMDAQKQLLRAGLAVKARQQKAAEDWCNIYQLPTRTEVDDLAKTVQELKREVRKLKKEIAGKKA